MALRFGYKKRDIRQTIWIEDPALENVSSAAREAWREDGDAEHLRPFCKKGEPTVFTFRNLNMDEVRIVGALWPEAMNNQEGLSRTFLMCFRIGVDLGIEDMPDPNGTGARQKVIVKERGIRMLAEPVVAQLAEEYPGIVAFYGNLIFQGSFATEAEKKASSPPSTPTPSSAAESTVATTGPSPPAGGVSGAP